MPFDAYEQRPDGGYEFWDSMSPDTTRTPVPPVPAARATAARIDALGRAAADAGLARAVTTNGSAERAYMGPEQEPGTNQVLPGAPQAPTEIAGPAGERLRLAPAAAPSLPAPAPEQYSPAQAASAAGDPFAASANKAFPPDPAPMGPEAPPPAAPGAPPPKVRMVGSQPGGFNGPAGAGKFQAPDTTELDVAESREKKLRLERLAELGRGGGYTPPSPEREQRVSVNRERRLGPDPDIIRETEAIETGAAPFKLPEELKAPLPTITTSEVKDLFAPPPGKNGKPLAGKELDAWAASVAADATKNGLSPATLATMMPARQGVPPKNASGEVLDAWEKQQRASHAAKVAAADERSVKTREKYNSIVGAIVEGEQRKGDEWVRKFGTFGIAGGEMRNQAIDAGLAQDAADAEVQRAGYTDAYARQREAILLRQRDKLAQIETRSKDLDARLAKGIDPDRFWKSKNTSEQVGLAIAMALGAIGAGLTHGPNVAQQTIDASIARDLEAQKEDLASGRQAKGDLQLAYKQVMDLTGSEMAATAAMEHAAFQGVEHDLNRKLALAKSEKAQIQGQALLAKIRKEQLQRQAVISDATRGTEATASKVIPATRGGYAGRNLKAMIEEAKAIRELAGSGVKLRGDVVADAAKAQKDATGGHLPERAVLSGTTYNLTNVTSAAEGARARKGLAALEQMRFLRGRMREEAKNYGTRLWNPGRFNQLGEQYKYYESAFTDQGVVRDPEMERHLKNIGSYTGGTQVIDDLGASEDSAANAWLSQLGAIREGAK